MKARLVIIIAGLFFFSCEKYDHRTESIDQLQKDVAGLIRSRTQKIPFTAPIAWAMIQNGKTVAAYRQGMEVPEGNTAVTDQSLFPLASATKLFTSVMIMKAFEKGLIQLAAKVSDYIDGLPQIWHNVSISQLLSHTDGIPDASENEDYKTLSFEAKEFLSRSAYLDYAGQLPLIFEPGAQTRYGQTGYVLLSMILEKIYKKVYEEIIADKILVPLGMQNTHFFTYSKTIGTYKPRIFEPGGDGFKQETPRYVYADYATAGICTSLSDMIKFICALQKHTLLGATHFKRLYTPVEGMNGFALGWEYRYKDGHLMAGHSGGWSVVVMHLPETNATSIFLSSAADKSVINTGYQLAEKVLDYTIN
ncbi:MAG: serine hydrolase domain-containing protein [Agriterribacter sp.]